MQGKVQPITWGFDHRFKRCLLSWIEVIRCPGSSYLPGGPGCLLFVDIQVSLHVLQGIAAGQGDVRLRVQNNVVLVNGGHVRGVRISLRLSNGRRSN